MSCCICKKSANFFNSKDCKSKHKIHKKCIARNSFFEIACKDCIIIVLKNKEKVEEGCILCREILISVNECKIYKNLCERCYAKSVAQGHLKKCKICIKKIQQKLSQCTKCQGYFQTSDLYKISRCEDHNYCVPCINRSQFNFSNCQNCQFYFNFIQKKHDERIIECNLCGKFPEGNSQKCSKGHTYCIICLRFLNLDLNLLNIFDRIKGCELCIQMLKAKDDQSSSSSPNILPAESSDSDPRDMIIDIFSVNYNYLQGRNCDTCATNVGSTYFCGHCHCKFCIGKKFLDGVYYVFSLINQRLFDKIPPIFIFRCITPGCNCEIPVPSSQIISLIIHKMDQESIWMYERFCAYFDGVPMRITSCSCNNIIIVQNGRKIFCACNQ